MMPMISYDADEEEAEEDEKGDDDSDSDVADVNDRSPGIRCGTVQAHEVVKPHVAPSQRCNDKLFKELHRLRLLRSFELRCP